MRGVLCFIALAAVACETRGTASELSMAKSCYTVEPGKQVQVVVQASDSDSHGADGLALHWIVGPSSALTFASHDDVTKRQSLDGVTVVGGAQATIVAASGVTTPQHGYVLAFADATGELLNAQAAVVVDQAGATCDDADAGVPDAGPSDAAP